MAAASSSSMEDFKLLLDNSNDYPLTLAHTEEFQHVLRSYRDNKLRRDDETWCLFAERRQPIWTWHLVTTKLTGFSNVERLDDVAALKGVLNVEQADSTCRFLYIQNKNARSGLGCSKEQLSYLFTYYQVLPALIDVTCAFRIVETVPLETSFRGDSCLRKNQTRLFIPQIGRSGYRFQHCFRLIGVEQQEGHLDLSNPEAWSVRHAAAYHAMDVKENRSIWIVIKGRKTLQEQLEQANRKYLENHPDAWKSPQRAFLANLNTHLLFFKWCSENWNSYIDALEAQMRHPAASAKFAPMSLLTDEPALIRRETVYSRSRQGTGFSDGAASRPPQRSTSNIGQWISQHTRSVSGSWRQGRVNIATPAPPQNADSETNLVDLDNMFNFDGLQRQYRLMEKYRDAITAIEGNTRILQEFHAHITRLTKSSSFKACINMHEYQEDVTEFLTTVKSIQEDLKKHSDRMNTLLKTLEDTISLFTGILEYNNSRITEHFARQAQASTTKMETWTKEMHKMAETTEQQTVSMHIITAVALFFLPGTFVASLFDSNILDFSPAETRSFGQWTVNMGALKLFFAVCLPITFITILSWYLLFRRHSMTRILSMKEESPGA